MISCQVRFPHVSSHRRAGARFKPCSTFPVIIMRTIVTITMPPPSSLLLLTFLDRNLLPQSLTSLLPSLLITHIIPILCNIILFQKPSRWIQSSPSIYDFHCHQWFIKSFGIEIFLLLGFNELAVLFVSGVMVGSTASTKEAVVWSWFHDICHGM